MRIALTFLETRDSNHAPVHALARSLASLGHVVTPLDVSGPVDSVVGALRHLAPDLVVNVAGGPFFPALYEHLGIPHAGSEASTLAVCADKALVKRIVAAARVPTPASQFVRHARELVTPALPVVLKPNGGGDAIVVHDEATLHMRLASLLAANPQGVLVEQFIEGVDVSVDWIAGGGITTDPALDAVTTQRLHLLAQRAFTALDVRGHGRARFRVAEDGKAYFLAIDATPPLDRLPREQLAALVEAAAPVTVARAAVR